MICPVNTLPFVQVDEITSLPLTKYNENTRKKVSTEAEAKLAKHLDVYNEKYGEKDLDKLVTRKGEESLLDQCVYIDGNNMEERKCRMF